MKRVKQTPVMDPCQNHRVEVGKSCLHTSGVHALIQDTQEYPEVPY
jgi:hypothetical protein